MYIPHFKKSIPLPTFINRHLGCFHTWADKHPKERLLDHMIDIFLYFWGTSILLYIVVTSTIYKGVHFLHILTALVFCFFFDNIHSIRYEVIPHCDVDLHYPDCYWCSAPLYIPTSHLYVVLGEMSIQVCSPFLIELVFFLLLGCWNSLYILEIYLSSDIQFANIFYHFVGCFFTLLIVSSTVHKLSGLM